MDGTAAPLTEFAAASVEPPSDCIDVTIWRRARELELSHVPASDGGCSRCGGSFPCAGHRLAVAGLATAAGQSNIESSYWSTFAMILAFQDGVARRPQPCTGGQSPVASAIGGVDDGSRSP